MIRPFSTRPDRVNRIVANSYRSDQKPLLLTAMTATNTNKRTRMAFFKAGRRPVRVLCRDEMTYPCSRDREFGCRIDSLSDAGADLRRWRKYLLDSSKERILECGDRDLVLVALLEPLPYCTVHIAFLNDVDGRVTNPARLECAILHIPENATVSLSCNCRNSSDSLLFKVLTDSAL
jgi:hypothetical protein